MHAHLPQTLFCWLLLAAINQPASAADVADIAPVELRCEYRVDPLGIDETAPRLSWMVQSDQRGQKQTAYRILVADGEEALAADEGNLWDSGQVESNRTNQVVYAGKPLTSKVHCYWKVCLWDKDGKQSKWSESACWSMGLLSAKDWEAEYISYRDDSPVHADPNTLFLPAARQYRKDFPAKKSLRRATVSCTALGIYELYLNGKRIGDAHFAPGWSDYRQRAYYNTYDVTDLVRSGENAIGVWLADGWYSGYVGFGLLTGCGVEKIGRYTYGKTPSVMLQLDLEYEDGSHETIVTDKSWKVTGKGPIQQADLLMGEFYDAQAENTGWSQPGFDDSAWEQAILAEENGHPQATFYDFQNPSEPGKGPQKVGRPVDLGFQRAKLEAFPGLPVRITEEITPIAVTPREEGTYIFNLGQNFAGTVRLKVKGPAGHQVKLRYGEMLHPDGRLMTENLRKARATDFYVCKGDPAGEVFTPRFTFHGFQYVEVSNFLGTPTKDSVTGLVMHSDTPMTSTFACSDPVINQIFSNVVWTQRANFLDLPTDCPQRDERMGWTGDAQAYVATAAYNADIAAFYTKWLRELMESQRPSGVFPGYAPFPFQHGWDFGTAWADAGVICPWTIWQAYGDTRVIEHCWEPMMKFMQWRKDTSRGDLGVVHGNNWGDWLAQGARPPLDYIDSIYFAISTKMMAEMAHAIGHYNEAVAFREQLMKTKAAFNEKYVRDDGSLTIDTQTAYALALYADLIPQSRRQEVASHLVEMLAENGNHMTTGFLGTRPLLPVLSSVGQNDLAVFLLQSREFPSWGYEVEQGATTIWERWDSYTKEDGFGRHNAAMNSFAHYSFGAVCEWMFRTLAGISSDGVGYRKIVIAPNPPSPGSNAMHKPIDWVKASHDCINGTIRSEWKVTESEFHLNVEIPTNTTATIYLPALNKADIAESDRPLDHAKGVRLLKMENGRAVLAVDSGKYRFISGGGLPAAAKALKTSKPKDQSINPDRISLEVSQRVAHWDFANAKDAAQWELWHNLKLEQRDGKLFLVSTGRDPQLAITLPEPLTGDLAVKLKCLPAEGTNAQFFWAGPQGNFNSRQQNQRELNRTDTMNEYLFMIGDDQPVQKLRFDPFNNKGEMQIESISIHRLGN